jgi:transglutaminase-like putative cysteine protease
MPHYTRRRFLRAGAALAAPLAPAAAGLPLAGLAGSAIAQAAFNPRPGNWRTLEVTTRFEVFMPTGMTRAWLPMPSVVSDYQQVESNQWKGNADNVRVVSDGKYGASMLYAEFNESNPAPVIELVSRIRTRDRATDFSQRGAVKEDADTLKFYLQPTDLIPTDGIVRRTALAITKNAKSDEAKARAIYEWICDNTFRDPKTKGCGIGDVKAMLETGNLGGKCADLNALFVGLARSVGLPARDVYGVRVVKSQFGYRSLGAGTPNITRAQHCRAEVYLQAQGWVPVDPADVRKVVLEEKPQPTTLSDPLVQAVRPKLFGAWEMNWLAYNTAHDITLPGSQGPRIGFLMYPQAENREGRLDSLDPDNMKYSITGREITA